MKQYIAHYEIYSHKYTFQFEARDAGQAWHVFWASARHTGEQVLPSDKGVLLSLLRQRAHIVLNKIEEI